MERTNSNFKDLLLVKTLGYAFCDYMVFEAAGLQSNLKILEVVTWNTDEHWGGWIAGSDNSLMRFEDCLESMVTRDLTVKG